MEEAPEPGALAPLVVDELHLHGLHRCHREYRLRDAGAEAAQEPGARRQLALLVHHQALEGLEGAETDRALRYRAVEEDAQAPGDSDVRVNVNVRICLNRACVIVIIVDAPRYKL